MSATRSSGPGVRTQEWIERRFAAILRHASAAEDGSARVNARQIYIMPTRIGVMFGSVVLVMLLGSLNYQKNLGLLFTFFLASVGVVAMHHAWFNLLRLRVLARGGTPVFAGEQADFEVFLEGGRRRPRPDLQVRLGREPETPAVLAPAGGQAGVGIRLVAPRRGWLRLPRLSVATRHPLRLFRAWCYVEPRASVLVYPAPARHAPVPEDSGGGNRRLLRSGQEGADDYVGSRDYRQGDSLRRIDWKAYARERGLVVKQFEGERGQEVWIDWWQVQAGDPEQRLSLLTRQVLDASGTGARFGLRLPGTELSPDRGTEHVRDCLTRLALFDHG